MRQSQPFILSDSDSFFEEDKPVPKYWAKVSGLDKEGRVAANPEDNVELSCQAIGK